MRAQTVKVEEHLEADLGPVEGVGAGLPRVIFGDGDDSSPEKEACTAFTGYSWSHTYYHP